MSRLPPKQNMEPECGGPLSDSTDGKMVSDLFGIVDVLRTDLTQERSDRTRDGLLLQQRVEREARERLRLSRETRTICGEAIALVHSLRALAPAVAAAAVQDGMN
eukprot:NODE_10175_length_1371_cov_6.718650.p3 GENE.NODE_10175_length_1371_cov_6.718650~~NODE_10175_length_1371_cov_6.718650.p3  ORF type:complete len:105 (-),score=33.55 NODE_10175_length_1371_cov_6.718650:389-703(-)